MNPLVLMRIVAILQILVGVIAFPIIGVLGEIYAGMGLVDTSFVTFARILAIASVVAGIATLKWHLLGSAFSALLLIPQSVSFVGGSILYALSLWPTLGFEATFPGYAESLMGFQTTSRLLEPTFELRTGASYTGFGVGFNLVPIGVLSILAWAFSRYRRYAIAPNSSFKPTPSARLNSRR